MNKQERKTLVKAWKAAELEAFAAAMPLTLDELRRLLDYLDANLVECGRTLKLTTVFLHFEQLDAPRILAWLLDEAHACDCEVLGNLDGLSDSLQTSSPGARPNSPQKATRTARPLVTAAGWNLSDLPKPWRVSNLYLPKQPVKLRLGKKDGCEVQIIERPMPAGNRALNAYWSRLWHARTKLPARDPLRVTRPDLGLPDGFEAILVRTPSWTPVICWIVPRDGGWRIEVTTELKRWGGDLPQIAALITRLSETAALDWEPHRLAIERSLSQKHPESMVRAREAPDKGKMQEGGDHG